MPQIQLNFNSKDDGLSMTGVANFARQLPISSLNIAGLAEWRHAPANVVHVNQETLAALGLPEKAKNLSKIGLNFIGIKARSNILLSFNVRRGKNGPANVKNQLTKFLKALGATSVKLTDVKVEAPVPAMSSGSNDMDDDNDDNWG